MKSAIKLSVLTIFTIGFLLISPITHADNTINTIGADLKYSDINSYLNNISNRLKKSGINSQNISEYNTYLRETRIKLENIKKDIETDIHQVEKKVEALGDVPADGNEVALISQKRKEFKQELARERARLSEADLLLARIEEIEINIFNLRHQELWGNLLENSDPLIYPQVLYSSSKMTFGLLLDIITSPLNWYKNLPSSIEQTIKHRLIAIILFVTFISFIGWILRRIILHKFGYLPDIEHPRFGRKVIAALMVWIAYGVIPTLIIGFLIFWIINGEFLANNTFGDILISFLYYSLFVIMAKATCRVIFTPYNERWRLINISTDKAKKVTMSLYLSVFMIGLLSFLTNIVEVQNYPIELMSFLLGTSASVKYFV